MISFSWDAFITLCFVIATVYGLVLQKDRLTVILVSAYIALAVANFWGESIYRVLLQRGDLLGSWAKGASLFTVTAGLFILFIILLSSRGGFTVEERGGIYTPFIMAALGFLAAGLILGSIISFMPEELRSSLIATSKMAAFVWKYHTLWIVLPPLVLVFSSIFGRSKP